MNKETKKDWRPIWLYLGISIFGSIIIGIIYGVFMAITGKSVDANDPFLGAFSLFVTDLVIAIIFLILYHKRIKEDIKKINKKNIIYIIVSAIILIGLNEIISRLFTTLNVEMSNQDTITNSLMTLKIPVVLSIVIMAPFIEEVTFRYSLRTIIKNKATFVIVSSIAFGLFHGIGIATLLYIFIGACLSIIYLKNEENIIAPISVHFLNNLIAAIEMLLLI